MEKNTNTPGLIAVIAGSAAGFAVGMMMAPKKGSDLRNDAMGYLDNLNEKVCDIIEQGRSVLNEMAASRKPGGSASSNI